FIVCWESDGQDGSYDGIFGQLFNSDGSKQGTEFLVNTYINHMQECPSVSYLSNGNFIICWQSTGQDKSWAGIYGQLFNSDGSKLGNEFHVNTFTDNDQRYPRVSHLPNGDFIICWQSYGQDNSRFGIYGQLFNSDGSKLGNEFQVNTYTDDNQRNPSVSYLSNNKFVICWDSVDQDGSDQGIFAKYYLYPPINHTLIPFSLLEPEYDEIVETVNVSFKWRQPSPIRINLPFEIEYHLYLDNNENFSNPRIISAIYDTTCTVDSLTPGTTYFWKVMAKNISGDSLWSSETKGFFVSYDATEVDENYLNSPEKFQLHANYPNPFNPETTIKYSLSAEKAVYQVVINIYDALGKLVMTLKDEPQKPGIYTVKWNSKDTAGHSLPSGIYLCVVQAGQFKAVQKMLLIR
ncbi:MAG: FlgD immunoglobulin-like domain containing protein, partial [bacterium]